MLNEIQTMAKSDLYANLRTMASELKNMMSRALSLSEGINMIDATDLTNMGITDTDTISDMVNFRDGLSQLVAFYNGTSTARTVVLSDVINKIRPIK
jgi:hypothetical protein